MDDNNSVNQESFEKQKIEQLEKEIGNIGNNPADVAPTPQTPTVQASPPVQANQTNIPTEVNPQGLKKSKGLLWTGVVLLLLSLVGIGGYYLGSNKSVVVPVPSASPTQLPTPFPNPTDDWSIYTDPSRLFTLKYPEEAIILNQSDNQQSKDYTLFVSVVPIDEIEDSPLNFTKANALEDVESLKNGEYGAKVGASMPESEKVISIKDINAKMYVSTWSAGACSVQMRRTMFLYYNNQRIMLSLDANSELIKTIIKEAPEYFLADKSNCNGSDDWARDTEGDIKFIQDLMDKSNSSAAATAWYETFDQILSTFEFVE